MTKKIFDKELANELKKRAGNKYRPSNGTEGEYFQSMYCYLCEKHGDEQNGCEILLMSMFFDVDEPDYPNEWQFREDGQPTCTAFAATNDNYDE